MNEYIEFLMCKQTVKEEVNNIEGLSAMYQALCDFPISHNSLEKLDVTFHHFHLRKLRIKEVN